MTMLILFYQPYLQKLTNRGLWTKCPCFFLYSIKIDYILLNRIVRFAINSIFTRHLCENSTAKPLKIYANISFHSDDTIKAPCVTENMEHQKNVTAKYPSAKKNISKDCILHLSNYNRLVNTLFYDTLYKHTVEETIYKFNFILIAYLNEYAMLNLIDCFPVEF